MPKKANPSIQIKNRRASFDYESPETYTAGIVLSGTEIHSQHIVAINGIENAVGADIIVLCSQLARLVQRSVDTCRLQVDIEDTEFVAFHVDISPHGTVVGVFKEHRLATTNGVSAIDNHILSSYHHIGEVFAIGF